MVVKHAKIVKLIIWQKPCFFVALLSAVMKDFYYICSLETKKLEEFLVSPVRD